MFFFFTTAKSSCSTKTKWWRRRSWKTSSSWGSTKTKRSCCGSGWSPKAERGGTCCGGSKLKSTSSLCSWRKCWSSKTKWRRGGRRCRSSRPKTAKTCWRGRAAECKQISVNVCWQGKNWKASYFWVKVGTPKVGCCWLVWVPNDGKLKDILTSLLV